MLIVLQLTLLSPVQDVYVIAESEDESLEYESISQRWLFVLQAGKV